MFVRLSAPYLLGDGGGGIESCTTDCLPDTDILPLLSAGFGVEEAPPMLCRLFIRAADMLTARLGVEGADNPGPPIDCRSGRGVAPFTESAVASIAF